MTDQCKECRFWLKRSDEAGKMGGGFCRRYPPMSPAGYKVFHGGTVAMAEIVTSSGSLDDAWPNVHQQSWCGEFSKKVVRGVDHG